jgi:hypothetical protein
VSVSQRRRRTARDEQMLDGFQESLLGPGGEGGQDGDGEEASKAGGSKPRRRPSAVEVQAIKVGHQFYYCNIT